MLTFNKQKETKNQKEIFQLNYINTRKKKSMTNHCQHLNSKNKKTFRAVNAFLKFKENIMKFKRTLWSINRHNKFICKLFKKTTKIQS